MEVVGGCCRDQLLDFDRGDDPAPNLSICKTPRVARSAPLSPAGKPMKFSMREEPPAWPPGPSRSSTNVDRPSDEA